MNEIPLTQICNTLADLKALQPSTNQVVLLIGKDEVGDGKGGFYRWDKTDTSTAQDNAFLNVITSTIPSASGRWVRVFQKVRVLPQGVLVMSGGTKTLYITPATTDANGKVTANLTLENTPTGTPIFSEIWQKSFDFTGAVSTANDVPSGSSVVSGDLKTVTYTFARGNTSTVTIIGINILGMRAVAAGQGVVLKIEGV